jgi:hypothetical protein
MKREIAEFVSNCGIWQQVKIEHQRPAGELQSLSIPKWKWEDISMDFVMGLPRGKKGNDAIWVVVDRLTISLSITLFCFYMRLLFYPRTGDVTLMMRP